MSAIIADNVRAETLTVPAMSCAPTVTISAGISKGSGVHTLRHYFATRLIHNGASVKRVQLALRRSSPTITLNTYVGEWPDTDSETRSIIDAALGSVPRMCPVPLPGGKVRS